MSSAIIEFDAGGGARQVWVESDEMTYPHGVWVDKEGFIYASETGEGPKGDRILKFQRVPK